MGTCCITKIIASHGFGGFFFDDQQAIINGASRDGMAYRGQPLTAGFRHIREPAEAVSVMLQLDDGYIALGDCASVQYSGVKGREPRLHSAKLAAALEAELAPKLTGLTVNDFRAALRALDTVIADTDGLGRSAAYGVSQALLNASAHANGHHLPARTIQQEWDIQKPIVPVPLYGQTGELRRDNVDKMIIKKIDALPHGLINHPALIGSDGGVLLEYIRWITDRIQALRPEPAYEPVIHLDVYGLLGSVTEGSLHRLVRLIQQLEAAAAPYRLQIEQPLSAPTRAEQIRRMRQLRVALQDEHSTTRIVVDEWANCLSDIEQFAQNGAADMIQIKTPDLGSIGDSIEAVLTCQKHGVAPILGGTCAETDISGRLCTHIGLATNVNQLLIKPGMGFDEGHSIVANEMNRTIRIDHAARLAEHRSR